MFMLDHIKLWHLGTCLYNINKPLTLNKAVVDPFGFKLFFFKTKLEGQFTTYITIVRQ